MRFEIDITSTAVGITWGIVLFLVVGMVISRRNR